MKLLHNSFMLRIIPIILLLYCFVPLHHAGLGKLLKKAVAPIMDFSEQVLGETVAASVKMEYGVSKSDPAAIEWVSGVFNRLTAHATRNVKYNVTILDSDIVNAFAAPGGYIFVTRGTLKKVRSDDDLAGVLGHEIGHVEARHSMKNVQHQLIFTSIMKYVEKKTNRDVATSMAILNLFGSLKYSRENEYEADAYGVRLAAAAGYNPYGMVSFLNVLKELDPREPSKIEVSIRSHPATSERIKRSDELASAYNPEVSSRPMSLTYNFGDVAQSSVSRSSTAVQNIISTVALVPTEIYRLDFEQNQKIAGLAAGLLTSGNSGIFVLDGSHKASGQFSQRITNLARNRTAGLISQHIPIQPNIHYILRAKIMTKNVDGDGDGAGRGACILINEFSSEGFLRTHYNIGNYLATQDFVALEFPFVTEKNAANLNLEFQLRQARGTAWFDEVILIELR